jgi:tight adherence protein B
MAGLVLALVAAYGAHLLYTSLALGWTGAGVGPARPRRRASHRARRREWMVQAGLGEVKAGEFAGVVSVLAAAGAALGYAVFGAAVPALALAGFAGSFPLASYRHRRTQRRATAQDAWPRMIEEIRILTSSLGRSIPQALFDVGQRGPAELRPAFELAHREWLLTIDFDRTLAVLKEALADPTADAACETLLIAHELGGTDLDRRLEALAEDRTLDTQGRKDARARQAGVWFAETLQ